MDFYQMKLSDIPSDVMEQLGSYLLEDKKKTIHHCFMRRKMIIYKYYYLVKSKN